MEKEDLEDQEGRARSIWRITPRAGTEPACVHGPAGLPTELLLHVALPI